MPQRALVLAAALTVVVAAALTTVLLRGASSGPAKGIALVATSDGTTVGVQMPDQGRRHIPDGEHFAYDTLPPTSGPHWREPAAWGIADEQLPDERTTHNLEHGGIVIAYDPGLPASDVASLKAFVGGVSATRPKMVLEPYRGLGAAIAVTAWRWGLTLSGYDAGQIIRFVNAHYQSPDAPEPDQP